MNLQFSTKVVVVFYFFIFLFCSRQSPRRKRDKVHHHIVAKNAIGLKECQSNGDFKVKRRYRGLINNLAVILLQMEKTNIPFSKLTRRLKNLVSKPIGD